MSFSKVRETNRWMKRFACCQPAGVTPTGPLPWQVSSGPSSIAANSKLSSAVNLAGAHYMCFKSSCSKGDTFCHQSRCTRQMEARARAAVWYWPLPKPYQTAIYRRTGNRAGPCASSRVRAESLVSSAAQGVLIFLCFFIEHCAEQ